MWRLILIAALPTAVMAEPYSFKMFKLDATRAEVMEARPGMSCREGPPPIADHTCSLTYETIAEKEVQLLSLSFYDDRLSMIRLVINQADFSAVIDALSERYGKPTSTDTSAYTNATGAKFDRKAIRWRGDRSDIDAREYGGRIDRSAIQFQMHDALDKFRLRRDRQRSGASKDL